MNYPPEGFLDVKALREDMNEAGASTTGQLLQKKGFEYKAGVASSCRWLYKNAICTVMVLVGVV